MCDERQPTRLRQLYPAKLVSYDEKTTIAPRHPAGVSNDVTPPERPAR